MELTYSEIALLFPAIPLLFLVFSNTSTAIGMRIGEIYEQFESGAVPEQASDRLREEVAYLAKRAKLLRTSQLIAGFTFLLNLATLFSVYAHQQALAKALFAGAAALLTVAIAVYLCEIRLSVKALDTVVGRIGRGR